MGSGQFIQDDYVAEIQRRACFKESKCGNYWLGLGFQQGRPLSQSVVSVPDN